MLCRRRKNELIYILNVGLNPYAIRKIMLMQTRSNACNTLSCQIYHVLMHHQDGFCLGIIYSPYIYIGTYHHSTVPLTCLDWLTLTSCQIPTARISKSDMRVPVIHIRDWAMPYAVIIALRIALPIG